MADLGWLLLGGLLGGSLGALVLRIALRPAEADDPSTAALPHNLRG